MLKALGLYFPILAMMTVAHSRKEKPKEKRESGGLEIGAGEA